MRPKTPALIAGTRTTAAIVAITFFAFILVLLHVLRPELDPVSRPTSEYAVGSDGVLMTIAFLSMSIATWALILGLARAVSPSRTLRIGIVFLALWGIGVVIAMLFPIDPAGANRTTSGTIHSINGPLSFLCLTIGMVLVSQAINRDPRWRQTAARAVPLSFLMPALLVVTIVSRVTDLGIAGLVQRIALVVIVAWFLVVATRLRDDGAAGGPWALK